MKWTDAQLEAIQTTGQDLCVTASAGSGKTAVLVERVLHLVRECRVPLDRIVAITFTEKAAAEMKDRLRNECRERENSGSREDMSYWRELARQVETARMSTIHAFCGWLLRQHALAFRVDPPLDPDFSVLDEPESHLLRAEVIDAAVEELLEQPHEETLRLAGHYGVYRLKEMLEAFLRNPVTADRLLANENFVTPERILDYWQRQVYDVCRERLLRLGESSALRKFRQKFEGFGGLCAKSTDGREQLREASLNLIGKIIELRDAGKIERMIQTFLDWKMPSTRKANWPSDAAFEEVKESQDGFKAFLRDCLTPPRDAELEQRSAELTRDAVACFRAVYDQYRAAKASRNALDFTDLILLTLQMLRSQPEVCERIARGIDHLLIDEFQDTDREQYEIARLLCDTKTPPELFIVGDAKQSIYRFRGAEVEVFEEARGPRRTIGLHRNFRTVPEVVQFVNALFARSGLLEAVEPEYMPAEAHRASVGECRVQFLIPKQAEEKESAAEGRTREAAMIGDWIAAACSGELDVRIQPKESNEARPVTFGDIAMLFRALSDVRIYERALSERNIPFHVIAGKGFYERQEVLDVRNLLEAVVDPWHEPAVLGFLRSPMAGLDDDSLLAICRGPGATAALLEGKTPARFAQTRELDHARAVFQKLRAGRARPLPDFVRYLLECTGYEAMLAGLFLGEQRVCNVRKVMQLAEVFAKTRRPRLSAFVRYLDDVAAAEIEEGEAALQAEGSDEVTIMSIHKSKGLEFPVVVLPDLSRNANAGRTPKVVFHRQFGVVARPYVPGKKPNPEPQIHEIMKRDEKAKENAERARLLYVATTRARDWLVLSGAPGSSASGKPPADSLLEPFVNEFGILGAGDGTRIGDDGWSAEIRRVTAMTKVKPPKKDEAEAPDWDGIMRCLEEAPVRPATQHTFAVTRLVHHMYPSDEQRREAGEIDPDALDPLMRGTLIHRYFELWDFKEDPPAVDAFLRREMPVLHLRDRLREELMQAAERLRTSDAWQLLTAAKDIQREAPFMLRVGDALIEGVIDALLDGSTILDYKTGLQHEGRGAMYEAQLCLYAEALYRLRGAYPKGAYLYYADSGALAAADISRDHVADVLERAAKTMERVRNELVSSEMEPYLQ